MQKLIIVLLCFFSLNLYAQEEKLTAVYPFGKADKWGVISSEREVIKKPKYDSIGFFFYLNKPAASAVFKKGNKLGLISRNGKVILKPKYDEFVTAGYHARDYHKVRLGEKWGLVNKTTGEIKLAIEYDEIKRFDGRNKAAAVIKNDGKFGVFSLDSGFLTPIEYDEILVFDNWDKVAFELKKGDQKTFIDNFGNKSNDFPLEEEMPMFEDQAIEEAPAISPSPEWKKIGDQNWVVSFRYDMNAPQGFKRYVDTIVGYDKVAAVEVYPNRYFSGSNIPVFHIVVEKDGKVGMLGENGKVMTPVEYDKIEKSKESYQYIYLIKGELKGVASKDSGKRCLDAVFTAIRLNDMGLFFVEHQNGYFGYANSNGDIFLPED